MKFRKESMLTNVILGAGVYLLDSLRDRMADGADEFRSRARDRYSDLRDRAGDAYDVASDRVSRATDVLRGEDHRVMGTAAAVLVGVGLGVGIGMLLAPQSGEETRSDIAEKMRDRFSREKESSTGTYGD